MKTRVILVNLRNEICAHNKIKFFWTKTHVANLGNEGANYLAKEGTLKDFIDLIYHPNKRHTKKSLCNKYLQIWQQRWYSQDKGRNIYSYIHHVDTGKIYSAFYLNQIVSGHVCIPKFQYKMFGKLRSYCSGHTFVSVQHIILDNSKLFFLNLF